MTGIGGRVPTLPRPGRRARYLAAQAAYGGGTFGGIVGLGYALLVTQAKLARRTIGEPTTTAPRPARSYGRRRRGRAPVHLVVLGDSAAAGLGCDRADQTPGALLAGALARDLHRRVDLVVLARIGARSAELEVQVAQALRRPVDAAVIVIGANDVTHRVPIASAARDLRRAVQALREAGVVVVVGTAPDLGTVKPLLQPLRTLAAHLSRRLAAAQTVATVEAGGTAVSLGDLLAREFTEHPHLWSADRFHPSAEGYARIVDALLPSLLSGLGGDARVGARSGDTVQDVQVAARVASHEAGVEVDALPEQPAAGRLALLRRRRPLVGQDAPAGPTDPADLAPEHDETAHPGEH
jgi:lysophospholipase L1-like esterase